MTGGVPLLEDIFTSTLVRGLKMVGVAKSITSNTISGTHFGDGKDYSDETFTLDPTESGYRLFRDLIRQTWISAIYHSFYFA